MSDEELGAALAKRFRDVTRDIEPSAGLVARVERDMAGGGRRRWFTARLRLRNRLAAVCVAAVAAVTGSIVVLGGSNVSSSFAVTRESNGAILITLHDIAGVTGANARLRQLGVPIVVVPLSSSCEADVQLTYMALGSDHMTSVRVIPAEIPPATTVVLAARQVSDSRIEMAVGRVSGPPPSCVGPGSTGPGILGLTTSTSSSTRSTTTAGRP